MYYKLVDAIDVPKYLSIVQRTGSSVKYSRLRLEPGKKYEIPEEEIFAQIKNAKEKTSYTPERERKLRDSGVTYEKKYCKSCGGRVLKLEYNVIEVIDDAEA